jgi:CheY-like chemotaxis protein
MLSVLWRALRPARVPGTLPTLLIVEGDRRQRASLIRLFAERRLIAILASEGTDALRQLTRCHDDPVAASRIDVVIADVDSAGLSGRDLLCIIREKGWPVRVVMTSRTVRASLREELLRNGATALVGRPVTARQWARILEGAAASPVRAT